MSAASAWAGQVLQVHQKAADLDAALECQLIERRVGVLAEFGVKRLLARGYNAKEKPVERFFKDVSAWEANTFAEYCGAHPQARPERWRALYQQHQQWLAQRRSASPFMTWETYEEALRGFLADWQTQPHERVTLGGQRVIPREEFARLYTTRVSWSAEAVALALLRAVPRVIRKNGVNCFQRDWFYWHPDLAYWKGRTVEIRYTERDYQRLWVVLPDQRLVEAELVTPTPLLQPNQATLQQVARARQREQQLIRDYQLLTQSQRRGETAAARVAQTPLCEEAVPAAADERAHVHPWPRLRVAPRPTAVVAKLGWEELPTVPAPRESACPPVNEVNEYDEEDGCQ